MIEKKLKCDEFLEIKKEFILNELKKFIDSDFSKKSIRAALNNVNDQRPLGDVFAGTKLARVFVRLESCRNTLMIMRSLETSL
jgi:hypothetical protein